MSLLDAMTDVEDALAPLGYPVRAVGDITAIGTGPALVVRPPRAIETRARGVWLTEVDVVVVPTSQVDLSGLVALAQTVLTTLHDAGLRCSGQPATLQTSPDTRITVYEITVEV